MKQINDDDEDDDDYYFLLLYAIQPISFNSQHRCDADIHVLNCEQQFFNPHVLYKTPDVGIDSVLRGLVGDSSQTHDQFLTKQVTCHLFTENPPDGVGSDLAALNIQRGRDHGIPS